MITDAQVRAAAIQPVSIFIIRLLAFFRLEDYPAHASPFCRHHELRKLSCYLCGATKPTLNWFKRALKQGPGLYKTQIDSSEKTAFWPTSYIVTLCFV
jgi:hypothetical protein